MEKNRVINLCISQWVTYWEVVDGLTGDITYYRTGYGNCGLWETVVEQDGEWWITKERQLVGDCDFRLDQQTTSGIRKALNRYFNS